MFVTGCAVVAVVVLIGVSFFIKREIDKWVGDKLNWLDAFIFFVVFLALVVTANRDDIYYD